MRKKELLIPIVWVAFPISGAYAMQGNKIAIAIFVIILLALAINVCILISIAFKGFFSILEDCEESEFIGR